MPQMGPMKWLIFLFIMFMLIVIFIVMVHESKMEKFELEEGDNNEKLKKWW